MHRVAARVGADRNHLNALGPITDLFLRVSWIMRCTTMLSIGNCVTSQLYIDVAIAIHLAVIEIDFAYHSFDTIYENYLDCQNKSQIFIFFFPFLLQIRDKTVPVKCIHMHTRVIVKSL